MSAHVLVIDDSRLYRETFCNLLRFCFPHAAVSEAEDGSTALSLTRIVSFSVLVLDYHLQSLSGGDIARRLRQRASTAGERVPPIILTSSQPDIAVFTRSIGAVAFMPKPATEESVLALLGPFLPVPEVPAARPVRLWRIGERSQAQ